MKNYVQPADVVTWVTTRDVTSGELIVVGNLVGVAALTTKSGEENELKRKGAFKLPKVSTEAWAFGDKIYWDGTAKNATKIPTNNTYIGTAIAPAANPTSVGVVALSEA
ncbi:MAG: DUF2190 family protein [Alsobacter sp.]